MRELQQALKTKIEERVRLTIEIENLRAQLRSICDHSETESYVWEHDNGYGTQRMISGKRCIYCLFVDIWDRGNFLDPATLGD